MRKYIPCLGILLLFLILKVPHVGIRLSDTNIYFYTAYQLLQGKILYKDIFFTNFPLFSYISAFYLFIFRNSINLYYATAVIEACLSGIIIYCLTLKKTQDVLLASTSIILYLFSFILLSTSDHQTGVFLTALFGLVSYAFFLKSKHTLSGVFVALAFLSKAYAVPLMVTYCFYFFIKKSNKLFPFLCGFFVTSLFILLPSLIFAPSPFFNDVLGYSLTRGQGIDKMRIAAFFLTHDFLLLFLGFYSIIMIRRQLFLGLVSVLSLLYFFLYQDIYYLYLNIFIPFLCLVLPEMSGLVTQKFSLQRFVIPTIVIFFSVVNIFFYLNRYSDLQRVKDFSKMVEIIKKEKPQVLYGVNDLTPILSYATGVPLVGDVVDTNENIFRKKILNASELTKQALKQKSLLVAHGAYYPQVGIQKAITDQIIDTELIKKNCRLIEKFYLPTEGVNNYITFFSCQ